MRSFFPPTSAWTTPPAAGLADEWLREAVAFYALVMQSLHAAVIDGGPHRETTQVSRQASANAAPDGRDGDERSMSEQAPANGDPK